MAVPWLRFAAMTRLFGRSPRRCAHCNAMIASALLCLDLAVPALWIQLDQHVLGDSVVKHSFTCLHLYSATMLFACPKSSNLQRLRRVAVLIHCFLQALQWLMTGADCAAE
jgi:hypothetical protein